MSDYLPYIPFNIQLQIIKSLPVKSLLQFRSVSTDWKSSIDDPEFIQDYIKNYHINHPNPQHHLLVRYKLDHFETYTSIVDDNNFPQQRFPFLAPVSLSFLRKTLTLASDDGLLCFYGEVGSNTKRAVIWNPTVGKSVSIDVFPNAYYEHTVVGFGVCHGDPMLVKISVTTNFDGIPTMWDVDVFSLSTRHWRNVHRDMQPFRLCKMECAKVCLNGVIYFRAYDLRHPRSNFFISFNLESGVFGEVPFPVDLVHTPKYIQAAKVNESLSILEYHDGVCDVWSKREGANETFTMISAVDVEGHSVYGDVLGFRNNGEVVVELKDNDNNEESRIVVYVPLTGHISGVGINGRRHTFSARSYVETAHLLDQRGSDIIIP